MQFGLNCKKACWQLRPKPRLPEQSSVVNKGDSFIFPDHEKTRNSMICFSEIVYLVSNLTLYPGRSEYTPGKKSISSCVNPSATLTGVTHSQNEKDAQRYKILEEE